jgi:hypothetical protein
VLENKRKLFRRVWDGGGGTAEWGNFWSRGGDPGWGESACNKNINRLSIFGRTMNLKIGVGARVA